MKVEILDDTGELVARAAGFVSRAVARRDDLVLGLPTGRTMVPVYSELARRVARGQLDLSRATAFNLDEVLLPPGHPASFRAFMERHAWTACGFARSKCHIPDASRAAADPAAECERYEKAIVAAGGFDVAILGLGVDGHVAYNLPGPPVETTHAVDLPEIVADSLGIPDERRPLRAITVGIGTLKAARQILLLATTAEKSRALGALRQGPLDERWPCSMLRGHPALTVLATRQAIEGRA
jgi:glucosamine-6-phosphate deaminase